MNLGKKLYKTSMVNVFRMIILAVVVFFFNNFYLETFANEKFRLESKFKFLDVINYHYRYPEEFITFFCIILLPALYYAFIRGICFCEKGFVYNGGVPFMNRSISFENIDTYKLLHPELAISVHTKNGDVFVVADNNIGRVIAILDQHNIKGNLASDEFAKVITNYQKFIYLILILITVAFLMKKAIVF